jgi:hypothetical protein
MKKRLVVLVAVFVSLVASSLSADVAFCQTCMKSYVGNSIYSSCVQAAHQQAGSMECRTVNEGAQEGEVTDCRFSGAACVSYLTPWICDDNNYNGVCDAFEPETLCPNVPPENCYSPLVIADGKYRFSDVTDPVMFDLNADGVADRTTWTARDSGVRFLWLDRNRNGRVDNGAELFGNHTSKAASNGFLALAQWDNPPFNGQIDEFDQVWPHLQLWEDVNHDGVSQPHEITRLADSDITALGLQFDVKKKDDKAGNQLRFRADLWRSHRVDKYYDVYFVWVPDGASSASGGAAGSGN